MNPPNPKVIRSFPHSGRRLALDSRVVAKL